MIGSCVVPSTSRRPTRKRTAARLREDAQAERPGRLRLVGVKSQVFCRVTREVLALDVGQRDARRRGSVFTGVSPKASAPVLGRAVRALSRLGYEVCRAGYVAEPTPHNQSLSRAGSACPLAHNHRELSTLRFGNGRICGILIRSSLIPGLREKLV